MEKLKPGLYEQLISEHLKQELDAIPEARKATGELDYAEAPKVFAQYVASIVEKKLGAISEKEGGIGAQAKLVNDMISAIDPEDLTVADGGRQLLCHPADQCPLPHHRSVELAFLALADPQASHPSGGEGS